MMLELGRILKGVLIMEDGKVLKEFGHWRDLEQILARSWNHLDSETILEGNVLKDLDRFEGFRKNLGSNWEGFLKMAFGRLWVLEFGRGLNGFCRRQGGRIFKGIWKTLEGCKMESEGFSRVLDLQAVTIPKDLERCSKDFGSICGCFGTLVFL